MFRRLQWVVVVLVCCVAVAAEAQVVGYWEFNEQSPGNLASTSPGAIIDSSGNGRHLTAQGDPELPFYVVGCPGHDGGSALNFLDPEDDELYYPDNGGSDFDIAAVDGFTVEALVGTLFQPDVGAIAAKDGTTSTEAQWWFRHEDGQLKFLVNDGTNTASVNTAGQVLAKINDGAWHHVAAVRDADAKVLRLYVDYQLMAEATDTTTGDIANDSNMTIAGFSNSTTNSRQYGPGDMDYVKITRAALSPEEFTQPSTEDKTVVALWDFEEGVVGQMAAGTPGEILDSSGNGRHATALGDEIDGYPEYVKGQCGTTALRFNDGPDAVEYPYSTGYPFDIEASAGMTFELVVRTSVTDAYQAFFARNSSESSEYWSRIKNDGTTQFYVTDGSGSSLNSSTTHLIDDGNWHHVAFVRDGRFEQLRLYVDYELVERSGEPTAGVISNAVPFTIAEMVGTSLRSFIGEIDAVRVSNGALTPDEFLAPPATLSADLDGDCDVDLEDFAIFQSQFTGPQ
jgi:hypothetical protein